MYLGIKVLVVLNEPPDGVKTVELLAPVIILRYVGCELF